MIKIFCNLCDNTIKDQGFSFEAAKQEVITDLKTGQKQLNKDIIHICQKCYNENIKDLLYGKGK